METELATIAKAHVETIMMMTRRCVMARLSGLRMVTNR